MDHFTALRADWKAQGCPSEHPYLSLELPTPIVPLIEGITPEMVAAASAMGFRAQSDANIRAMFR